MTTKLIKHDGHWIVVSDEEPKKGEVAQHPNGVIGVLDTALAIALFKETNEGSYVEDCKKVIFSQNPNHNLPTITFSDEVAKELGIVDVEKLAKQILPDDYDWQRRFDIVKGYNQCLLDNADKKFTLEDVRKAIELAREGNLGYYAPDSPNYYFEKTENEIIQSLTKEEYNIIGEIKKDCFFVTEVDKQSITDTINKYL